MLKVMNIISGPDFHKYLKKLNYKPENLKNCKVFADFMIKLISFDNHISPPKYEIEPSADYFEVQEIIGGGAYGMVFLADHIDSDSRVAVKAIKKSYVKENQRRLLQAFTERDILSVLQHPATVRMLCSYETETHLCLVMELVQGGTINTLLHEMGTFSTAVARQFSAELVLAIEYIHNCGIIHRDLKPENLLLTLEGHIKVTDFGLAIIQKRPCPVTDLEDCTRVTRACPAAYCGTPGFMAPELTEDQRYGTPVDWFALGVIIREFLCGIRPAPSTCSDDLERKVPVPEMEGRSADLIGRLMERIPEDRLGARGAAEVKNHPFFVSTDWDNLFNAPSLYIPNVADPEDLSNFEMYDDGRHEVSDDELEGNNDHFSFGYCSPSFRKMNTTKPIEQTSSSQSKSSVGIKRKRSESQSSESE